MSLNSQPRSFIGRPMARASLFGIADLISPQGTQTSARMFVQTVNRGNVQALGNTRLKQCVIPGFLVSDQSYEKVIEALNKSTDATGWQVNSFSLDHSADRFDSLILGLKGAIEDFRMKRRNDVYFDPYVQLASLVEWSPNGLFSVAEGNRAAPRKVLEFLLANLSSQGVTVAGCKVETLELNERRFPPMHLADRKQVIKLRVR